MTKKTKKSKPLHFRLGLGSVAIGVDSISKVNPQITFKQLDKSYETGTNILFNDSPLEDAEVTLEIVGLEGFIVLEKMLKGAKEVLESEEELLKFYTDIFTGEK